MTSAAKSPVTRSGESSIGTLIVTLGSAGLLIRKKGTRTTYGPITYGALLTLGAKLHASAQVAEKKSPRIRRNSLRVGL